MQLSNTNSLITQYLGTNVYFTRSCYIYLCSSSKVTLVFAKLLDKIVEMLMVSIGHNVRPLDTALFCKCLIDNFFVGTINNFFGHFRWAQWT